MVKVLFLISSSSILSSSSHLMTKFDEFRVLCDETFTGKYPSSLVVFRSFLHCCFVSTSIKTDFIGLHCRVRHLPFHQLLFFITNAFKSSGNFNLQLPWWEILAIGYHLDFHLYDLKFCLKPYFDVVHHMWGHSGHNPDPLSDYFINTGLGISPMAYSWLRRSAHTKMEWLPSECVPIATALIIL